jgi:hypothetical protein
MLAARLSTRVQAVGAVALAVPWVAMDLEA